MNLPENLIELHPTMSSAIDRKQSFTVMHAKRLTLLHLSELLE